MLNKHDVTPMKCIRKNLQALQSPIPGHGFNDKRPSLPLAEDGSVERSVEDDSDAHEVLLALHLQVADLRHRGRLRHLPRVEGARRGRRRGRGKRGGAGVEHCKKRERG